MLRWTGIDKVSQAPCVGGEACRPNLNPIARLKFSRLADF
jgi:hypothetical protein